MIFAGLMILAPGKLIRQISGKFYSYIKPKPKQQKNEPPAPQTQLGENFAQAIIDSKNLNLSTDQQLNLYAFYKQSNEGDCDREKPSILDIVASKKYNSWIKLKDTSRESAMESYINLVQEYSLNDPDNEEEEQIFGGQFQTFSKPVNMGGEFFEDQEVIVSKETQNLFDLVEERNISGVQNALLTQTKEQFFQFNEQGVTIFHYVIDNQIQEVFKILLEYMKLNDCVNIQDNQGMTPLHYAVLIEDIEIITALIDIGADIEISDKNGETPYDMAEQKIKKIMKKN